MQLLGYGWAGIFRKFLVESPYMWWPSNLVQVSLFRFVSIPSIQYWFMALLCLKSLNSFFFSFWLCGNRALHEKEELQKGQQTRLKFFLVVFGISFAYYIIPGYLFPSISAISFVCWIWKSSVTAQILGSGLRGLGIGSFGLDWSTVAGFLGSPLAVPFFAIANFFAGFFIFLYIVLPIFYWSNAYDAQVPLLHLQDLWHDWSFL